MRSRLGVLFTEKIAAFKYPQGGGERLHPGRLRAIESLNMFPIRANVLKVSHGAT